VIKNAKLKMRNASIFDRPVAFEALYFRRASTNQKAKLTSFLRFTR